MPFTTDLGLLYYPTRTERHILLTHAANMIEAVRPQDHQHDVALIE